MAFQVFWFMSPQWYFSFIIIRLVFINGAFRVALVVKNLPASEGDARDVGSVPGSGRSPGLGNSNLLHYFCHGKYHGQRTLVGYGPWGHKESDTLSNWTHTHGSALFFSLLLAALGLRCCIHRLLFFQYEGCRARGLSSCGSGSSSCCMWPLYLYHTSFVAHGLWNLSSLTKNWTCVPCNLKVNS